MGDGLEEYPGVTQSLFLTQSVQVTGHKILKQFRINDRIGRDGDVKKAVPSLKLALTQWKNNNSRVLAFGKRPSGVLQSFLNMRRYFIALFVRTRA